MIIISQILITLFTSWVMTSWQKVLIKYRPGYTLRTVFWKDIGKTINSDIPLWNGLSGEGRKVFFYLLHFSVAFEFLLCIGTHFTLP